MNRTLRICTIAWFVAYSLVFVWFQFAFQPASYPGWVWTATLTYLYVAPFIGAFPGFLNAIAHSRHRARVAAQWRSNDCADCGYNLRGIKRDVCPECGNNVSEVGSADAP